MKNAFLTGKTIFLRGLACDDLPDLQGWINDAEVTHFLFMGDRPAHLKFLQEDWEKGARNPNEVSFAVVNRKTGKLIGWAGLYVINWISRTAEYRVFIGDKASRGKGIGTEVARLLLAYGFDKLNLQKVWLGVNAEHVGGVKSYQKAGFVREGVLRREIYRNGKYYDAIRMSVLREEYEKSK